MAISIPTPMHSPVGGLICTSIASSNNSQTTYSTVCSTVREDTNSIATFLVSSIANPMTSSIAS